MPNNKLQLTTSQILLGKKPFYFNKPRPTKLELLYCWEFFNSKRQLHHEDHAALIFDTGDEIYYLNGYYQSEFSWQLALPKQHLLCLALQIEEAWKEYDALQNGTSKWLEKFTRKIDKEESRRKLIKDYLTSIRSTQNQVNRIRTYKNIPCWRAGKKGRYVFIPVGLENKYRRKSNV